MQRVNHEGDCIDIRGVMPLDEQSLLESAMRATGLSDFGADDWREPFRVYIKALEEEAELHLIGRIRARCEILLLLEARLQIEDTYKRHPEIADEQIVQPIIVVGQGRSGTSFLVNVLAANPNNGALTQWEAMYPCPPPEKATYMNDPRIEKADKLIKHWVRVTPAMETMHEWAGHLPQECCEIMAINFMSDWLGMFGQAGSYDAYLMKQDITVALRYHKRVLKLLQWKNPRRHWVLKSVKNLDSLEPLLKVYPDACFVWPHRDPVRALASMVSLVGTIQWCSSDHPFNAGSFEFVTDPQYSAQRINGVIDQLEAGVVPPRQMFHLLYKDLVGDTMSMLEAMYRHCGIPLSEEGRRGMAKYLADNPRSTRPPHKFGIGSDEAVARARQAYQRYQEYFRIPEE